MHFAEIYSSIVGTYYAFSPYVNATRGEETEMDLNEFPS